MQITWEIKAPNAGASYDHLKTIAAVIEKRLGIKPGIPGSGGRLRLEFKTPSDNETLAKLKGVRFGNAIESVTELNMKWEVSPGPINVHGDPNSSYWEHKNCRVCVEKNGEDDMFARAIKHSTLEKDS